MAVYDLEEQEKIDDLKLFWRRWGNAILAAVIAVCIAYIAMQGWRWWTAKQAEEAAVLYAAVAAGARDNDVAKARDAMGQLSDRFASTGYAPRAALLYAKLAWDQGDKAGAKAQLHWVVNHAREDSLKELARDRLAEVLIDEKQYDQALAMLDARHAESFAGLYADRRGDALAAAGRLADAKTAYQTALAKLDPKSAYRNYVQVKLDALPGGQPVQGKRAGATRPVGCRLRAQGRRDRAPCFGWEIRRRRARGHGSPRKQLEGGEQVKTAMLRTCGLAATLLCAIGVSGCSTTSSRSWLDPSSWALPAPSLDWLTGRGSANKPGALPPLEASVTPRVIWQANVGRARPGLAPVITASAIYAAASDGTLARLDPDSGRTVWRIAAARSLSAGPGADADVVVVGTDKGEVLAFDADAKPLWTSRVSSEVIAPPLVAEGVVVVTSGDGRIYGLNVADGKTKWVHQRVHPALTIRNTASPVASRGGVFIGTPGGRLLALDLATGIIGWDGTVATPKGATELERIADVTSRPVVEERQACAVAFQGRVACFEILRGTLNWTRDLSSLSGIAADEAAFYVVDDSGALHALDKSTGASLWKQDRIAPRRPTAAQVAGEHIAVLDIEGYLHLFAKATGAYVGRLATDGTPPTGQPLQLGERILWQSLGGNVYVLAAR